MNATNQTNFGQLDTGSTPTMTSFINQSTPAPSEATSSSDRDDVWSFFRDAQPTEAAKDEKNRKLRYCVRCTHPKYSTAFKTNARHHLQAVHSIIIDYNRDNRAIATRTQQSIEDGLLRAGQNDFERSTDMHEQLRISFNREHFLELQTLLIVRRRLPFTIVSWPEYRALILCANPAIEDLLISSPTTVAAYIRRSYSYFREGIKEKLHKAKSCIHFSSDMWSSPNRKGFLGVTAQWVDEAYTLQKALLGMPEVQFDHSGAHQSRHLLNLIRWYEIHDNLGYFVGDNASSNDTCMRALSKGLRDEFGVRYKVTILY